MRPATIVPGKRSNSTRRSFCRYRSPCWPAFISEFFWVERASRESGRADGAVPSHSHAAFIRVYAQAKRLAGTRKGLPEARRQKFSRAKAFAAGYAPLNLPRDFYVFEQHVKAARSRH